MLTWFPSHQPLPAADRRRGGAQRRRGLLAGVGRRLQPSGDYHDEIHDSLLVLKALTYCPTGGIVAAPTTSLPEQHRRRSATGTTGSAGCATPRSRCARCSPAATSTRRWSGASWLLRAIAGDPADLQIMYGIAGERRLDERELDWLPGYDGLAARCASATPPSRQLQLDVYGELLDAAYQTHGPRRAGRPGRVVAAQDAAAGGWRTAGARRTPASGRCAAPTATSRTPR